MAGHERSQCGRTRGSDRSRNARHDAAGAVSRRAVLAGLATVTLVPATTPAAWANAPDAQLADAIRAVTKGAAVREGRVRLAMPELAENGNSVSLSIAVESPMTAADHVRQIHVLSEKNPIAGIARFRLGPRAGRAEVKTNVRLATTQKVVVLAEASDGGFWSGTAEVVVTITACLDGG